MRYIDGSHDIEVREEATRGKGALLFGSLLWVRLFLTTAMSGSSDNAAIYKAGQSAVPPCLHSPSTSQYVKEGEH